MSKVKARKRHAKPIKSKTPVRRLLYAREQTAEALGGISISSVIRLEREGRLSKVRLRGLSGKVFNPVDEVEALASAVEVINA